MSAIPNTKKTNNFSITNPESKKLYSSDVISPTTKQVDKSKLTTSIKTNITTALVKDNLPLTPKFVIENQPNLTKPSTFSINPLVSNLIYPDSDPNFLIKDILAGVNSNSMIAQTIVAPLIKKIIKKKIGSSQQFDDSYEEMKQGLGKVCDTLTTGVENGTISKNSLTFALSVVQLLASILDQLASQVKNNSKITGDISNLLTVNSNLTATIAQAMSDASAAQQAELIAITKAQLNAAMNKLQQEISSYESSLKKHTIWGCVIGGLCIIAGIVACCVGAVPLGVGLIVMGGVDLASVGASAIAEHIQIEDLQSQLTTLQSQIGGATGANNSYILNQFETEVNSLLTKFARNMKIINDVTGGIQILVDLIVTIASFGALAELTLAQAAAVVILVILPSVLNAVGTGLTMSDNTNVQEAGININKWSNIGGLLFNLIDLNKKVQKSEVAQDILMVAEIITSIVIAIALGKFITPDASNVEESGPNIDFERQSGFEMKDFSENVADKEVVNNIKAQGIDNTNEDINTRNEQQEDIEMQSMSSDAIGKQQAEEIDNSQANTSDQEQQSNSIAQGLRKAYEKLTSKYQKVNTQYQRSQLIELFSKNDKSPEGSYPFRAIKPLRGTKVDFSTTVSTKGLYSIFAGGINIFDSTIQLANSNAQEAAQQFQNFCQLLLSTAGQWGQLISADEKETNAVFSVLNTQLISLLNAANSLGTNLQKENNSLTQEATQEVDSELQVYKDFLSDNI